MNSVFFCLILNHLVMTTRRKSSAAGGGDAKASAGSSSGLPRAGGSNQPSTAVGILLGIASVYLSIPARQKAKFYIVWIAVLSLVSAFYDFDTAHSYWTQKHNIFNQYGVKIGWFWTTACVGPFIWWASRGASPDKDRSLWDMCRLVTATGLWYLTVQVFHRILYATSRCDVGGLTVGRSECSVKGGKWLLGLDISGHCFLMVFSILMISSEAPSLRAFLKTAKDRPEHARLYTQLVNGAFLAMAGLHLFWDFQLIISCLYYHIIFDKVAGAATAVGCWALIYRILAPRGILPLPVGTEKKPATAATIAGHKHKSLVVSSFSPKVMTPNVPPSSGPPLEVMPPNVRPRPMKMPEGYEQPLEVIILNDPSPGVMPFGYKRWVPDPIEEPPSAVSYDISQAANALYPTLRVANPSVPDPWLDHWDESWLDENDNFTPVVPKIGLPAPFDIIEDPWCDLTFLRKMAIFKDMYIPSWEDLADSGYGPAIEALQAAEFEAQRKTERREENIYRKMMMKLHPELVWCRQKKKGRTARRRRWAREERSERKWQEEMKRMPRRPRRRIESSEITPAYDEQVMKHELPRRWKTSFWMMSFVDDGRDYKYAIWDKTKETFYPAEPKSKRELGYELLEFMPVVPRLSKRSNSICGLDREGFAHSATIRNDALALRRTKSETTLDKMESSHWNLLKDEVREEYEADCDLFVQLVDAEIQDEIDRFGLEYFYAF
uniref:Fitm-2 n=1 Tax=Pristionchus pacificus TaxID=54126 RepID=A0A2A6BUI1_PRIPA|eukprot:PDM69574.1 fitm-2 [Pristionchus pacificus]